MNSIRLKEIGRKIIRPSIVALLVLLASCDMAEVKQPIRSLITLMNLPASGRKLCHWEMAGWE